MNDKKNPKNQGIGSGYLQSKILNAKERIEYEVRNHNLKLKTPGIGFEMLPILVRWEKIVCGNFKEKLKLLTNFWSNYLFSRIGLE
jgi:hypothetical protein